MMNNELGRITINMLANKFELFGSRESEVFQILRARYKRVNYGKPSSQDPKSPKFCMLVFNFLGFCHFPFYFFQFEIEWSMPHDMKIYFFVDKKSKKFCAGGTTERQTRKMTETEKSMYVSN